MFTNPQTILLAATFLQPFDDEKKDMVGNAIVERGTLFIKQMLGSSHSFVKSREF